MERRARRAARMGVTVRPVSAVTRQVMSDEEEIYIYVCRTRVSLYTQGSVPYTGLQSITHIDHGV